MLRFRSITWAALAAIAVLAVASMFQVLSSGWCVVPIILWGILTTIGSFHLRWNYHVKALCANPTTPNPWVSLTFDDGPDPEFTPKVLDLLERFGAKATFFCIGERVAMYPGLAHKIISKGHTLGNHTYSHDPRFGFFGVRRVVKELQATTACIEQAIGRRPRMYRPAFGVTNPSIRAAIRETGLEPIGWSIRSLDTTRRSVDAIYYRTARIRPGDIVLLHDTSVKTMAVLERLLLFLQANQWRSVPVDRLLEITAYA